MDVKVFIFEDNQLIRQGLEAIINGTPGYTCCGTAPNTSTWETALFSHKPDVILMDIEMPGMNGIETTQKIKEQLPDVKILIQTVFDDSDRIFDALCSGASGYILKNDPPARLLEAINEVMNGGAPLSPAIAKKVINFFTQPRPLLKQKADAEDYNLSEREKEILGYMVKGHNLKAIAEKCFISYETVRSHVKKIYRKLHVTTSFEAIYKANEQGLV